MSHTVIKKRNESRTGNRKADRFLEVVLKVLATLYGWKKSHAELRATLALREAELRIAQRRVEEMTPQLAQIPEVVIARDQLAGELAAVRAERAALLQRLDAYVRAEFDRVEASNRGVVTDLKIQAITASEKAVMNARRAAAVERTYDAYLAEARKEHDALKRANATLRVKVKTLEAALEAVQESVTGLDEQLAHTALNAPEVPDFGDAPTYSTKSSDTLLDLRLETSDLKSLQNILAQPVGGARTGSQPS